ncbi:glycosyltransferase [Mucilaginibacter myungsuensis]|uniref:Glycosyltransferase n=1 Tax=Mucilaginibacter myungsuensis TaxID=649104 RepID=A0A929PXD2_9SPHI|nr:glycosyltransferase [Mucilaginibacter myungsuensis]MBE9663738.1 glycosyltransferase [Mucilaginibacter myungsuensis]MDN3598938.1 glycosyltransferase [Mucilaginibacter myungsuensis]
MLKVVISGVNLVEGGILSVLQDSLRSIGKLKKIYNLDITVLIHDKELIEDNIDRSCFNFVEFPLIKTSWLKRLKFEYIESKTISQQITPDLWISLHDITPNVDCKMQVVYCHNPSVFYTIDVKRFFYDIKFSLFCLFYKYLYQINIKRNAYVIIQQKWIRNAFKQMYGVNSIISYPIQKMSQNIEEININEVIAIDAKKTTFFYPSFPRIFKNFEVACKAAEFLERKTKAFQLIITLNGSENKYAKEIISRYGHVESIHFIGIQKRAVVQRLYQDTDCLIFSSKLETWGLPISEFKEFNKKMLLADLPYAHETLGDYQTVNFFDPDDYMELADQMEGVINNTIGFVGNQREEPSQPFFDDWDKLMIFLLNKATEA